VSEREEDEELQASEVTPPAAAENDLGDERGQEDGDDTPPDTIH
jgi:hypothetical protein